MEKAYDSAYILRQVQDTTLAGEDGVAVARGEVCVSHWVPGSTACLRALFSGLAHASILHNLFLEVHSLSTTSTTMCLQFWDLLQTNGIPTNAMSRGDVGDSPVSISRALVK